MAACRLEPGPRPSLLSVEIESNKAGSGPFSFFLRDVNAEQPIYIPAYGVVVTAAGDTRGYAEIAETVDGNGLITGLGRIELEAETGFAAAAKQTVEMKGPSWLGLSRDFRIFSVSLRQSFEALHSIEPRYQVEPVQVPGEERPLIYQFMMGRGVGCAYNLTKRLDGGVLPILRACQHDGGVEYQLTAFVSLEDGELAAGGPRGTHYLAADGCSRGHEFTEEQQRRFDGLIDAEKSAQRAPIFCLRLEATNPDRVPRYAFFKVPEPQPKRRHDDGRRFDAATGTGLFAGDEVYGVYRLDGRPMGSEELVMLLQPGQTTRVDCFLPHSPVDVERGSKLAGCGFIERLEDCRIFWRRKLATAATVTVPERRITEMIGAGLLQMDVTTYGLGGSEPCAAVIGRYSPIGSESSPIIQFFDSMGWHDLARRCLDFFLEKQRDSGQMLNFFGYTIETGAALWCIGEHYRYTRDDAWIGRNKERLLRACRYIIDWRERNRREELRGQGYGMLDGKVADDEDAFHIFKNSGYAYLGLKRMSEALAPHDAEQAALLRKEAEEFRSDIRDSLMRSMALSPVVPLADGTWCPSTAPWTESVGPTFLQSAGGKWYSHAQFACRDALHGSLCLIFNEVVDPHEQTADFLLAVQHHLYTVYNVAFSQPYHSRHDYVHLLRGEVKPFLSLFYNALASLADRETYEFWEHYMRASPHKTHEQGWFLMQCRCMLYMERGDCLCLLSGVPRAWLAGGEGIRLDGVASYFGPLSLTVSSKGDGTSIEAIEAEVVCPDASRLPARVALRVPHPGRRRPKAVRGGQYDAAAETVLIDDFSGRAEVVLCY